MKRRVPPDLKWAFLLSFGLGLMLFAAQCALVVALAVHAVIWRMAPQLFDARLTGLTLVCTALNGFALARAVKVCHFLSLFGAWPGLPEEGATVTEIRLLAASARQAFFHGDYAKVTALIDRLGAASAQASLAKGRALALAGCFDDALPFLEAGGQKGSARRYLAVRRILGAFPSRYFSERDISWALRWQPLVLMSLLALGVCIPMLLADIAGVVAIRERKAVEFSDKDFSVSVQGRFTLYYHDPEFMQKTADMAEESLSQTLAFLELPERTYGTGQIHLYLCADQAEYLSRSPYTRSWEAASAFPAKDQVYVYPRPENQGIYYEVVVAHELTHLCYHHLVPDGHEDSWLNEGLADYMGYKFALERANYPRMAWLNEKYFKRLKVHALPFDAFLSEDPRKMKDTAQINDFYVQGFSIVYVLIEQYGREPFLSFLRAFGSGETLPKALAASYPTIRDANELQAVWGLFMR